MKAYPKLLFTFALLFAASILFSATYRSVDPLILPQWHSSDPWNARCPGNYANRANAGSHALALAKTLKYWAYPSLGTGSVSYVDDNYGTITSNFAPEINWSGMSNTLVFQATQRFIFMCGASVYTDYEPQNSSSTLSNVRNSLINFFSYDTSLQIRDRQEFTNFYWKAMIRQELDASRPVIYTATLLSGREVAFIVDGYDEDGLFHINWSDANVPDAWVELNNLSYQGELIPDTAQQMLTGIRPSLGPISIDENFETDFSNYNWQFSGHANWTISSEAFFYGSQSAKSGNINDNQSSSMFIQINVTEPDTISFYKKVSCESQPNNLYDHLAFLIDGVEQQRWSGNGSWEYHEYPVTPGVHEFRWTYSKDGATTYYGDCAWVDAVDFPAGTTPLNPPRFAEAQIIGGHDVTLNWAAPAGPNLSLLGYRVYRNGTQIVQYNNPAQNFHNDYNLPNGDYTYHLRAVYAEGLSGPGNSASVTIEVPYAPTNLVAELSGVNTGYLSWQAPPLLRNRALMGYKLYRDDLVIAEIENPEELDYSDLGLAQGTYYYKVSAIYASGESVASNTVLLAVGVPEPPFGLQAVVNGSTVNLSWLPISQTQFLTGFKIFRNSALIHSSEDPLLLGYSDQNLPNGSYSYQIKAVYSDTESGFSAPVTVSVEVPYPPTGLTVVVNDDDVTLSWVNPLSGRALTHYYIYRDGAVIAAVFNPNTTSYQDLNLPNGEYSYQVTAFYSGLESVPSTAVVALVEVLYPPSSLSATVSLADVFLSWNIPATHGGLRGFLGYKVYRNGAVLATIDGGSNNHYNDNSVPNGVYDYAVTALYTSGESTQATVNGVQIEILYPVNALNYQINGDDVNLWWNAPPTGPGRLSEANRNLLNYRIYRNSALLAETASTSYDDLDLANGVYQYWVTAVYDSGEALPSETIQVEMEILYPPLALQHSVTASSVSLNWEIPATSGGRGLLGYKVYRDDLLLAQTSSNSYTDAGLANGVYIYKVSALYAGGESAFTDAISATVQVLYTPNQLQHSVLNRNDVVLNWQAPQTGPRGLLGYKLYRNDALIIQTTELSYTDLALPDGSYSYKVTALYESGESQPSNSVNPFIEYPWPPTGLLAEVALDAVNLSWDVLPGTQVRYLLFRDGVQIADLALNSYQDSNLPNGSYSYYLQSSNASESGISDPCAPVTASVELLYPPTSLSYQKDDDDVILSWNVPATFGGLRSLLGYDVARDGVIIQRTSDLTYRDADLPNGIYQYYITAVYDSGSSQPSNTVTVNLELPYPASLLSHIVDGNKVSLSWTAAPNSGGLRDFLGYNIYRDGSLIGSVNALNYEDLGLTNGIYQYYVTASYSSGESTPTNTVTATVEVSYPPSNLSYQIQDDDVILSWNAAPNQGRALLGYKIYKDGSILATLDTPGYIDADLANGSYQYYVTALWDSGESEPSNTVTVNLEVLYPATNLTLTVNGDEVSLNWTAPASSGGLRALSGYKLLRNGSQIALINNTEYLDADLANGIYQYSVIASYTSGDAAASNIATAIVEVLYAPSSLSYQVYGDAVSLNWTPAPNQGRAFLAYNIYRDGNLWASSYDATYLDSGLANGSYQYYVTANYESGESAPTSTVTANVEVLYPPTNLSYQKDDDDVILSWTASASSGGLRSLLGYDVFRDGVIIQRTSDLTYRDANLPNGIYQYHITAVYDSGSSEPSNTVTVNLELLYPASLLSHLVDGDKVSLSWTAAPNSGGLRDFLGYNIYRDGSLIGSVNALNYEDMGLANGIYQYYVTASYSSGESTPTNTISATVEVLYPPSGLSISTQDDDISLSWNAPTNGPRNLLGYKIYRNGAFLAESPLNLYNDQNLSNGHYSYQVSAFYDSGESILIGPVSAEIEVPYPVTALSATVVEDTVTLSWTLPATSMPRAFQAYFIYRDGALHQVLSDPSLSTWTDTGLANGDYSYYLLAVYDAALSIPSNTVFVNINVMPDLPAPSSLSLVMTGTRDLRLAWLAPAANVISYQLYRNDALLATTTELFYLETDLPNGSYQYHVKALYAGGLSSASNSVTANIMIADPVTGSGEISLIGNSASFSWNAPGQGEIGYLIYRNGAQIGYISDPLNTSYVDNNLPNGDYIYQVAAVYPSLISALYTAGSVRVLIAYAPNALILNGEGNGISLSWTAPTDPGFFTNYKIYRNGSFLAQSVQNSYSESGLTNGTYSYYVTSQYQELESSATNTQSYTVGIANPPSALSATVILDNVSLAWTGVSDFSGFTQYQIYRNGSLISNTSSTSWQDSGLANGSYSYQVSALYGFGESLPSNTVQVDIEVLYPATNLSYQLSGSDVQLAWSPAANSGGLRSFLGYKIYRDGAFLSQTVAPSYTDQALDNGSYLYHVVASYSSGDSAPTSELSVQVELLYAPSELSLSVSQDLVSLSWTPVPAAALNFISYRIYRDAEPITTTSSASYEDSGLANGSYVYMVRAVYPNGESAASNSMTALVEVAYAPQNLSYQLEQGDVTLNWQAPAVSNRDLLGYQIFRNDVQIAFSSGLSYLDAGLSNGNYSYHLIAEYSSGLSAPGNSIAVPVFVPYTPLGLTVSGEGNSRLITWSRPNQGELGYRVYRNGSLLTSIANPLTTSYSDSNIPNGNYSYQVAALYPLDQVSALSDAVQSTVLIANPPAAVTVPSGNTTNTVTVNWVSPSDPGFLIGYRVRLHQDNVLMSTITVPHPDSSTCVFTGLFNGYYQVYAEALYGTLADPVISTFVGPITARVRVLYPPTGVTATIVGRDIQVNWNAPADSGLLMHYTLYHNFNAEPQPSLELPVSSTSYLMQNLPNGIYLLALSAKYGTDSDWALSDYSNMVTLSLEAPYPPSELMAQVEDNDVSLNWTAPATMYGFQHYDVFRNDLLLATCATNSYQDNDLPNGQYSYSVVAVFGGGTSTPSNEASVNIMQVFQPQSAELTISGNNVQITWTPPTDTEFLSGYQVFRDHQVLADLGLQLNHTDADLPNGDYSYGVKANYAGNYSEITSAGTAHVELAYPPFGLEASATGSSINISWNPPSDLGYFQHYRLYLNDDLITEPSTTNYTFEGLPNGDYVVGLESVYESTTSIRISAPSLTITQAYPAQNFGLTVLNNNVTLTWDPPQDSTGLIGYEIWRDNSLLAAQELTGYQDREVNNGEHVYYVKAVYANGQSADTDHFYTKVMLAYPPSNLSYQISGNIVQLLWQKPSDSYGLEGYKVYRNGQYLNDQYGPGFTDGPLPNGLYSYWVTAVFTDSLESSPTATISFSIQLAYPAVEAQALVSEAGYLISWQAPESGNIPDTYKLWFLTDGQQSDPASWVFVDQTDAQSLVDSVHGGLSHGEFLWAVVAVFGELEATPCFTNILSVGFTPPLPEVTKLLSNYPNPFNPSTNILFWLKQDARVRLEIFNSRGQRVRTLVNTSMPAGRHTVPWDGLDESGKRLASGVYLYRLEADGYSKYYKMTMMK
jgi:hypothetical protein